jgi:hypothetical protein
MKSFLRTFAAAAFGLALLVPTASAQLPKLLIIFSGTPPTAELLATGKFSAVDSFDGDTGTPALGLLLSHDTILAFSDQTPSNPSGLGDVLADAVDAGKPVTVATYAFSTPWAIAGRIATAPYAPLVNASVNGNVSGNLVAIVPTDPIFAGVNLGSVVYFHNGNFAHPSLAPGAVLLANDGDQHDRAQRQWPRDGYQSATRERVREQSGVLQTAGKYPHVRCRQHGRSDTV